MKWIFSQNLALGRIPLQIPSRVKFNLRICDTHNFVVGAPTGNCSACLCWFTMEGEFPNKFDIHTHSINTTCQSRYLSYQRNHSSIVQWEQRWSCFYSLSLSLSLTYVLTAVSIFHVCSAMRIMLFLLLFFRPSILFALTLPFWFVRFIRPESTCNLFAATVDIYKISLENSLKSFLLVHKTCNFFWGT